MKYTRYLLYSKVTSLFYLYLLLSNIQLQELCVRNTIFYKTFFFHYLHLRIKNIQFKEEKLKLYIEAIQDTNLKLINEYYFNGWIIIESNEQHEVIHFIN